MKNEDRYMFNNSIINGLMPIDSPIELQDKFLMFIKIPRELIVDYNSKVLATYLYISVKSFGECIFGGTLISLRDIAMWLGYSHGNGMNSTILSFLNALITLRDVGYIDILTDLELIKGKRDNRILVKLNEDIIEEKCKHSGKRKPNEPLKYTQIYFDELERIINAKDRTDDISFKTDLLLKVFVYLRYRIKARRTIESVTDKEKYTETYEGLYTYMIKDIAADIKSTKTLAMYINVTCDINLIYKKTLKICNRFNTPKNENPVVTLKTIFCNTYVRFKNHVIRGGEEYCINEIKEITDRTIRKYKRTCKYVNRYNNMSEEQKQKMNVLPPLYDDREDDNELKKFEDFMDNKDIYNFEINEDGDIIAI